MTDSFSQRKWAGAPHSEKRQGAPPEPSKLAPRSKKPKKDIVFTNLYQLRKNSGWYDKIFCVHVGSDVHVWGSYHAGEHVIRRMKSNILRDTRTSLCWIESQIEGPVSPEFHNFENLMNWLIFKGLYEGWLFATSDTVRSWRTGGEEKRVTRLSCR